jgi:hypothetical protein
MSTCPCSAAGCSGVRPLWYRAETSAQASSSVRAASSYPRYSGVRPAGPLPPAELTSTPVANSILHRQQLILACTASPPSSSGWHLALGLAPLWRRSFTRSAGPVPTARWSGVKPYRPIGSSIKAPWSSRMRAISASRAAVARCRVGMPPEIVQ